MTIIIIIIVTVVCTMGNQYVHLHIYACKQ